LIYALLIVAGLMLGAMVGRWWAVLAAVVLGVWIALNSPLDLPGWFVGSIYGGAAAAGIAGGVALRKRAQRRS
jgi:hypothetical protein